MVVRCPKKGDFSSNNTFMTFLALKCPFIWAYLACSCLVTRFTTQHHLVTLPETCWFSINIPLLANSPQKNPKQNKT